jgi:hypothetical protein
VYCRSQPVALAQLTVVKLLVGDTLKLKVVNLLVGDTRNGQTSICEAHQHPGDIVRSRAGVNQRALASHL